MVTTTSTDWNEALKNSIPKFPLQWQYSMSTFISPYEQVTDAEGSFQARLEYKQRLNDFLKQCSKIKS